MNQGAEIAAFILFVIAVAVVVWFHNTFGLDWPTSVTVAGYHALFVGAIGVIKYTELIDLIQIIPLAVVGYLACWRPALDYWSNGAGYSSMMIDGVTQVAWYANGWIQFGIAASIIVFGYFILYSLGRIGNRY